jgi:hypothetical protein
MKRPARRPEGGVLVLPTLKQIARVKATVGSNVVMMLDAASFPRASRLIARWLVGRTGTARGTELDL